MDITKNRTKTSIIIPTYNEKDNIGILLKGIHESMVGQDYEVIIVDDDSPDGTAGTAECLTRTYPVKVVIRKGVRGLATAVVEGFRHAKGEVLVVMDADLQHPPEKIVCLLTEISNGFDIAIASRLEEGGYKNFNFIRKTQSKVANLIGHLLIHKLNGIKDIQSGFFAFRKEVIDKIELKPRGYKILIEILALGNYKTVSEISCKLEKRRNGETKLTLKTIIDYILHILDLSWRTGGTKRCIKYCMAGGTAILISVGLLWFMTDILGVLYIVSGIISKIIVTTIHFNLSDRWVFKDRNNHKASNIPTGFDRIIGCDGAESVVRKHLKGKNGF